MLIAATAAEHGLTLVTAMNVTLWSAAYRLKTRFARLDAATGTAVSVSGYPVLRIRPLWAHTNAARRAAK